MRKKSLLVHSNQELYREINEEISQLLEANIKIKDFTHPKICLLYTSIARDVENLRK